MINPTAGIFPKIKANGEAIKITDAILSAAAANFGNVVLNNIGFIEYFYRIVIINSISSVSLS